MTKYAVRQSVELDLRQLKLALPGRKRGREDDPEPTASPELLQR